MSSPKLRLRTLTSALLAAGLVVAVTPALGLNQYLKTWQDTYPDSKTDNASCNLCHGTSNNNLNAYGKSLCDEFGGSLPSNIVPALLAIQFLNSDLDPTLASNLAEINANAQPGWTAGFGNKIYDADVGNFCAYSGTAPVPSNVPLPYDPPAEDMPVAIPGGPYAGNVNVPITFDGSGSYDSDATDVIVLYTWNFGDGTQPVTTDSPVIQHTYSAADEYAVTLQVEDDEGDKDVNSTSAVISAAAVLDLDIVALKPTSSVRVGKPISIQLSVENPGTVLGQALATVTGVQDGVEVYRWTLNVYDYNGKGSTSFSFPSYTPKASGTIIWNATIVDVDPDVDQASAKTVVK